MVFQYHVTNLNHHISTATVSMTTSLDRMVKYLARLLNHKVKQRINYIVLQGHFTDQSVYIFFIRKTMATKLGSIITYLDGILPIKSHEALISWSCEIMWQTQSVVSLPSKRLLPAMMTFLDGLLQIKSHGSIITWSCKIT